VLAQLQIQRICGRKITVADEDTAGHGTKFEWREPRVVGIVLPTPAAAGQVAGERFSTTP